MDAVVFHTYADGRVTRLCLRCACLVDENGDPDQDHYSARQYLKFMAVPPSERCKHNRVAVSREKKDKLHEHLAAAMKLVEEI